MRLIDADAYKEQICSSCIKKIKYTNFCPCGRVLDLKFCPTAYDAEKVVEEMENLAECKVCRENGTDKRFYYGQGCKACAFGKMIGIAKRGGVE